MKKLLLISFVVSLVPQTAKGQLWSGILPASRGQNWTTPGVVGGIPSASWRQCGATIAPFGTSGSPAAPTTIQNQISSCGANQYVLLGAGTFYLSRGITVTSHNNIEIRGMGANQTFLVMSGIAGCQGIGASICFQSSDTHWKNGISNGPVNWTAGYSEGTTTIRLASVPHLKVGFPIILDQLDDARDTGGIYVCQAAPTCSLQGNAGGAQRTGRDQVQIVTVTGCGGVTTPGASCSGRNVVVRISPGLYMPNWNNNTVSGGPAPQAWWATNPILNIGVQDLSIDNTASEASGEPCGVAFFNALNGWVQGVRDIDAHQAHVNVYTSARITIRNNYFFLTQSSVDQSYGLECDTCSDVLMENNILQAVSGPLTINGACAGCVMGYNYDINNFYTGSSGYSNAMSNLHTAGVDSILYEGNIGPQIYGDNFHGTRNFATIFRNYLLGTQPVCWVSGGPKYFTSTLGACSNDLTALSFLSYSRFMNIIGNVLGTTGVQTTYQLNGTQANHSVYIFGGGLNAPDPNVLATSMRWGNVDDVTGFTTPRFCGNSSDTGWSTTCAHTSEIPASPTNSAQIPYEVPVPSLGDTGAGQSPMPASFYYSSKPSWWPGGKPWPPIGPDVSSGNVSGVGGHVYTIPAEDCYLNVMGGAANGTGGPYSFNAKTCYGRKRARIAASTGSAIR